MKDVRRPSSTPQLTPRSVAARYAALFGSSWRWLALVAVMFAASVVGGIIAAMLNPGLHADFLRRISESLEPALAALREGNSLRAIGIIFWRNLSITLLIMGTGALVFPLVFGLLIVGSNAYLLGVIIALSSQGPTRLVSAILPHGLFELPALLIAAGWSLKMGVAWLLPEASGRRGDVWRETVLEGLWMIPIVVVLLAIAAVVEVLVSGPLYRSLGT
jgi:stage II sporulation protein M